MKKDINYRDYISRKEAVIGVAILNLAVMLFLANFLLENTIDMVRAFTSSDFSRMGEVNFKSILSFKISEYPLFYTVAIILSAIASIKLGYKLRSNYGSIVKGQKGTSEFTTIKELRAQYRSVAEKTDEYKGKGGVPISREKDKIYIDDSPVNNLIIGTTRSGKGETFVFPTIDIYSRAEEKSSMIINDPKGELVSASYDTLRARNYDIQVLNLLEPMRGMSYNPLQIIIDAYKEEEYSKAQTLCNTLTFSLYNDPTAKDKFWQLSAQSLVNAIILAIVHDKLEANEEEKITLYTVANFLADLGGKYYKQGDEEKNALDDFFQNRGSNDIAKMQYATSNFSKGTTRGSIFASAMAKLQIFTFEEIAKMTSKSSYELKEVGFGKKPVAIFMVTPDYDPSNHVIASIFIRQLYYILAQKASLSDSQRCEREVVFLLDEFGNMPPIEGMANIITVCLGRNIRFNMIVQSYSQLRKLYGEDEKTIVGNCGNQIYILTNDLATAEHFSKLIGYKTISTRSRSGKSLSMDKSKNESVDRRELLNPNELMSLKEGESVVARVIKRQDKNRNRITPKPIYNTGRTTLKFRYEYLEEDFSTNKSIGSVKIECLHSEVDLDKLIYFHSKDEDESEIKTSEKKGTEVGSEKDIEEMRSEEEYEDIRFTEKQEEDLLDILDNIEVNYFQKMDVEGLTVGGLERALKKYKKELGKDYEVVYKWLDSIRSE